MNVWAPISYRNATPEIRAGICNGAGPAKYGQCVPDTLWLLSITEAANIHDWMYAFGRDADDRERADNVFLSNMIAIVERDTTRLPVVGFVLRCLRRRRALTYYMAVREFGNKAFLAGKE